ncbi:hypothetical protein M9H77_08694 [Catharanthus roseus]|uniref:Uncharacterized protein n=1 Tax=Catharanthus roseus TaxID=4058 RepID=A0ACC0BYU0_CATRO|nr:hypothetical protein M9H77_08694 [Catharanthus roseus]
MELRGDFLGRCPVLYSSPDTSPCNGKGRYDRGGARSGAGGTRDPREKEIMELIDERDWPRQFIAQFLGTNKDSVDRAHVELESRPGCSGTQCPQADRLRVTDSQSPNHANEVVSESSQNRQSEPIRKATPRPEQARHKFPPLEFYEEVEQEIKAELFLEQLNDIYDTLKYEDALRVTFTAFRL